MSILVWFTLLQFYWFQSYMISGGVGTSVHHSLPRFHHGKTAPGGGRGSRGPIHFTLSRGLVDPTQLIPDPKGMLQICHV